MPGRSFSPEFKLELVRQLAAGEKRPAQVCREHNLTPSLLHRWRKQYDQHGELAFSPGPKSDSEAVERRLAELERFCGQLALENSILKKALQTVRSRSDTR
jgi:transposase-like protein